MTEEDAYCKGYNQGYTKGFEQGKEFQEQKDRDEFLEDLNSLKVVNTSPKHQFATYYFSVFDINKLKKKWEARQK